MEQYTVSCALINFGGSMMLALGAHPYGDYWPIGIDNPYNKQRLDNIHLCDAVLSVSGNMPVRPKHIIRPVTGEYVEEQMMVVVVATHPVDAEVLTTALMVSGVKGATEWLNRFKIREYKIYNC
jgi:thiamine biosynthesis lipoprotein